MHKKFHFLILTGFLAAAAPVAVASDDIVAELGLREAPQPLRQSAKWNPAGPIVVRVDSPERLAWFGEVAGDAELIGVATEAEAAAVTNAVAVIGFCSRQMVDAAPDLYWIQIFSAGAERCIAQLEGADRDFLLTNMQRASSPGIAEHVIGMLLSLVRGLHLYIDQQSTGEWNQQLVPNSERTEIGGRTMLLVGLGGIGTAVAQRAHGLGMRTIAVRASGRPGPDYVSEVGTPDRLLAMAAEADVVVNSAPLTAETRAMFDADFFAAMKPGGYFINVGRGGSVVTDDLIAALETGRLNGAALDVTNPEPLPAGHPLWEMPNVIITPHVSAGSDRVRGRVFRVARENLRRYVAGEPMLSVVDIERGY